MDGNLEAMVRATLTWYRSTTHVLFIVAIVVLFPYDMGRERHWQSWIKRRYVPVSGICDWNDNFASDNRHGGFNFVWHNSNKFDFLSSWSKVLGCCKWNANYLYQLEVSISIFAYYNTFYSFVAFVTIPNLLIVDICLHASLNPSYISHCKSVRQLVILCVKLVTRDSNRSMSHQSFPYIYTYLKMFSHSTTVCSENKIFISYNPGALSFRGRLGFPQHALVFCGDWYHQGDYSGLLNPTGEANSSCRMRFK